MKQAQLEFRAKKIQGILQPESEEDIIDILNEALRISYKNNVIVKLKKRDADEGDEEDQEEESLDQRMKQALDRAIQNSDAQMLRACLDYRDEQMGKEYLSQLNVNVVPYKIRDDSLLKIVIEADDRIVDEMEEALKKRRG